MPQLRINLTQFEKDIIVRWARSTVTTQSGDSGEAVKSALLVEAAHHLAWENRLAEENRFDAS